ncbi:choice-of-anchor A family protein, partial [Lutibacter holmesii]
MKQNYNSQKKFQFKIKTIFLILFITLFVKGVSFGQCTDFISQLDGSGGVPDPSIPWVTGTATYPSPIGNFEMGPGNVPAVGYRGLDTGYAVVVGGDYTIPDGGGAESEGRVAVGGDFINNKTSLYGVSQSGGGTFVIGAPGDYALAVDGNIEINAGSVSLGFNNSTGAYNAIAGGSITGTLTTTSTGTSSSGSGSSGVSIAGVLLDMASMSTEMSTTAATGSVSFPPFGANAVFTGTNSAIEIFNVTAADLVGPGFSTDMEFANISANATIIINVSGTNVSVGYRALAGRVSDPNIGSSDADALVYNLVWNFYEATSVTNTVDLNGALIAPLADLDVKGNINGRVYIGGNLTHSGAGTEIHNYPFLGDLSSFCISDIDNDGVLDADDICTGGDDNLDTDGDTIPDYCDLDDDNDGILDVDEITSADLIWASEVTADTALTLPYTVTGLSGSDVDVSLSAVYSGTVAPTEHADGLQYLSATNRSALQLMPSWGSIDTGTGTDPLVTYTFEFTESVVLNNVNITDIDRQSTFVDAIKVIAEDENGDAINLTLVAGSNLSIDANGFYYFIGDANAGDWTTEVDHWLSINSNYVAIKKLIIIASPSTGGSTGLIPGSASRFGVSDMDLFIPVDTDGDTTPDYLDLDSDGDGCFDAIEGAGTYDFSDIDASGELTGAVDTTTTSATYGVPNSSSQAIGISRDSTQTSDLCDDDNDGVSNANDKCNGFDDANDIDGDGIPDFCDLDDDNDGILDSDECTSADLDWNGSDQYEYTNGVDPTFTLTDLSGSGVNVTVSAVYTGTNPPTESLTGDGGLTYSTDGDVLQLLPAWTSLAVSGSDPLVTYTFEFTESVILNNVDIKDLDRQNTFTDAVKVLAEDASGNSVTLDITEGSIISIDANGFYYFDGDLNSAFDDETHWLKVNSNNAAIKKLIVMASPSTGAADGSVPTSASRFGVGDMDLCLPVDTDSDSTPNYLDLDSDEDGCFDAFEGAGSVAADDIDVTGVIIGSVDANGVPTLVSGGQGVGDSQNAMVKCNVANNDFGSVVTGVGGQAVSNVLDNDTFGYVTTPVLTQVSSTHTGVTLNTTNGSVNVTAATPAGVYTIIYEACETSNTNCVTAVVTIEVLADTDGDTIPDVTDPDNDNDGISDVDETSDSCTTIESTIVYGEDFGTGATSTDPYVLGHTYDSTNPNDGYYAVSTSNNQSSYYATTGANGDIDAGDIYDSNTGIVTGGSTAGRFLIINIDSPNFTDEPIYRIDNLSVIENQDYSFRIDVAGLCNNCDDKPNFTLEIEDASTNNVLTFIHSGDLSNDDVWRRILLDFNSGTATSINILVTNHQPVGGNGNDVGIDNIYLYRKDCDADGDNIANVFDLDSDNDGILDIDEGNGDLDNDGTPNFLDLDSDNDGCPDAIEGDSTTILLSSLTSNGSIAAASDSSGIPGGVSQGIGSSQDQGTIVCCDASDSGYPDADGDDISDSCDLDNDNDGILDTVELGCPTGFVDLGVTFNRTDNSGTITGLYANGSSSVSLDYELLNNAEWAGGVKNASNGSVTGAYIQVQPKTTNFPLSSYYPADVVTIDAAVYTFTYTEVVYNVQFSWGGIDNGDRADFIAYNGTTEVPVVLTSSNLATHTIEGQRVYDISGADNNNGANAPNNAINVRIQGPITKLVVVAGKSDPVFGDSVTMQFFEHSYCVGTDTDEDGIPNHLDTDSDNDSCPDASEGANGLETSGTLSGGSNGGSNANLGTVVNTNGIPTAATGGTTSGTEVTGQNTATAVTTNEVLAFDSTPISASESGAVCVGSSITYTANATGTTVTDFSTDPDTTTALDPDSDITYKWYSKPSTDTAFGTTVLSTSKTLTVSAPSVNTDYKVVIASANNSCPEEETIILTVNALPTAPTVNVTQPLCFGETGTIVVNSPTLGTNEQYVVTGTSPVVAAVNNTSGTITNLTAGDYNVQVENTVTGCISTANAVTINAAPTAISISSAAVAGAISCNGLTDGTVTVS